MVATKNVLPVVENVHYKKAIKRKKKKQKQNISTQNFMLEDWCHLSGKKFASSHVSANKYTNKGGYKSKSYFSKFLFVNFS